MPTFSFERFVDENTVEVISGAIIGHGFPRPVEIGKLQKYK